MKLTSWDEERDLRPPGAVRGRWTTSQDGEGATRERNWKKNKRANKGIPAISQAETENGLRRP